MFLDKLEIVGFKSFGRKTKIRFNSGITGVVGPNGCGKSNIVDSIRWVLGEQKAGTLRSERMENVIFSGSRKMKPLGMAEVSMTITNSDNTLPVEYSDVVITRRLFRSGESQYLLNNTPCRLKDIVNLFMDSGMGFGAYSVIELKMVEQILSGKPEERRKIFEQAAGVSKYKQRRVAAFRKLENTEKDLLRINDIVAEVQKTVNSLHRQVARARRHEELTQKLFTLEISTATHQFSQLLNELDPIINTFTTLNKDYERITAKVNLYDADVEALKTQLIQTEQRLSSEQKKLTEINTKIQKQENEIVISRERIKSIDENRERDESEKNELVQRINGLEKAGASLKLHISSVQTELQEIEQNYSGQKTKLQLSEEALQGQRKQRQDLETQQAKVQDELTALRKKQDRLGFELEMKRKQYQESCENETGFAAELKSLQIELEKIEENYSALDLDIEKKQFEKEELEQTLEGHNEEVTTLKNILFKGKNKIDDLENRIQLLRQLIDSFEDYPEGVRHLMLENGKGDGFLGAIADHIRIPSEYRLPIEVFLGESSVYLLTASLKDAQSGIEELRDHEKGFVNFVPLENSVSTGSKTESVSELDDKDIISRCDKIVRCEPKLEAILKPMFQCCYLVKSFDAAKRLAAENGERALSFVTLNGEMVNTAGIVKGGKKPEKQGSPIGRLDELQKLENQQADLYDETEAAEIKLDRLSQEIERQHGQNKQLNQVLTELAQEKTKLQISLGQIKYRRQQHQEKVTGNASLKEKLEREICEIESAQEVLGPEIERLQNTHETTVKELFELKQLLATKELENSALAARVHELNLKLVEKQGTLSQTEHEMKQNADLIQEFSHTIETKTHNIESGHSQKDELQKNTLLLNNALEAEFVTQDELEVTVHRFEAERAELTRKTDEITRTIRGLRFDRDQASEKAHSLELKISEIKLKAQNIQQRILEEFEVEIKRASIDPEFNFQEAHTELEVVRKQLKNLGPVNSLAIKEYDTEKERLDFLVQQQNDLDEARKTLTDTIELINKEAQTRFLETFDEVQKNFREVFHGFFPHGAADILMTRTGDVLENEIELIANPKTKRMSALALLSGGEKTLTAISLLFAIYLVKPSPFCILDEVDAPLDDMNIDRFVNAIREFSSRTQFILVTHNKLTMKAARSLYGVTMGEDGISKVVSVKIEHDE